MASLVAFCHACAMDEFTEEYSFAAVLHLEPDDSSSMEPLLSDALIEAARSGELAL